MKAAVVVCVEAVAAIRIDWLCCIAAADVDASFFAVF